MKHCQPLGTSLRHPGDRIALQQEKLIRFIDKFDSDFCDCDDKSRSDPQPACALSAPCVLNANQRAPGSEDCAEVSKTIKNLKTDSPLAAAPAAASSPES
jgi:hypothetical protein